MINNICFLKECQLLYNSYQINFLTDKDSTHDQFLCNFLFYMKADIISMDISGPIHINIFFLIILGIFKGFTKIVNLEIILIHVSPDYL